MKDFITISGQLANGKDELGLYLIKKLKEDGFNFNRASFASPVKQIFCDTFGFDLDFVEEWKRKAEMPEGMLKTVRQSLQFIGDGFREIKPNIWIELAFRNTKNLVFLDGRYVNESKHTQQNNGVNFVIWRPGFENNDPNQSEAQIRPIVDWCLKTKQNGLIVNKDLETIPELKYYDFFVRNDGTLSDLHRKIDILYYPLLCRTFI